MPGRILDVQFPDVQEQASPIPSQHIETNPNMFGGAFGKAQETAGKDITQSADTALGALTQRMELYNQTAADQGYNNFLDMAMKKQWGDPNDPSNPGIFNQKGQDAMKSGASAGQDLEAARQSMLSSMPNGRAKLMADVATRRLMYNTLENVNRHVSQQTTAWQADVANAGIDAKIRAGTLATNEDDFLHHMADAEGDARKLLDQKGLSGDKNIVDNEIRKVDTQQIFSRFDYLLQNNQPGAAIQFLNKYKSRVDPDMLTKYKARIDDAYGLDAAQAGLAQAHANVQSNAATAVPQFSRIEQQYGLPQGYLAGTHRQEGNGVSSTGAAGPFAFTRGTAERYGLSLAERWDWAKSADAAARLAADNRAQMKPFLGREPTASELYLAHQQGALGALKLLANPNARAGDQVGDQAIRVNGGDPNAPASAFTNKWLAKFSGANGTATVPFGGRALQMPAFEPSAIAANMPSHIFHESVKADAYDIIDKRTDLTFAQKEKALRIINEQTQNKLIQDQSDAKAKRDISDQAAGSYMNDIITGKVTPENTQAWLARLGTDTITDSNPHGRITWETAERIRNAALAPKGEDFGNGWMDVNKGILNHTITSADDVFNAPELTYKGQDRAIRMLNELKAHPDEFGVQQLKASRVADAKQALTLPEKFPGERPDYEGLHRFNHDFMPAFESAYDAAVHPGPGKKAMTPMEFLTDTKSIDALVDKFRPSSQELAKRKLAAGEEAPGTPQGPLPPAPDDIANPNAWQAIVQSPPQGSRGGVWPYKVWADYLDALRKDPSPENIKEFDARFGPAGYDAQRIIGQLKSKDEVSKERDATQKTLHDKDVRAAKQKGAAFIPPEPQSGVSVAGSE